jgi:hypothetical protein
LSHAQNANRGPRPSLCARHLPAQDVARELQQTLCAAKCGGQLASCDRDQPVLRSVLQVEQLDEGRGRSVAARNDLAQQSRGLTMVLTARAAA